MRPAGDAAPAYGIAQRQTAAVSGECGPALGPARDVVRRIFAPPPLSPLVLECPRRMVLVV